MEIGRVCVKIAGRDSGNICVVVDGIDNNFVLIDGNVRRRKCNILHLEPIDEILTLKKGASHTEVASEFKKLKLDVWERKSKKKFARQDTKRISKKAEAKETAEAPKTEKKEVKPKKK